MDRDQILDRIQKRALLKHGQDFSGSLFDDLIDDGLIPEGKRRGNIEKRPRYEFSRASYRRALQIVRLRSKGITGRNAIRVNLFLSGYSQPAWDVREALRKEFLAFAKSISKRIRSGYANNQRSIEPKHKASLLRQIGIPDARFQAAGLNLEDDQVVEALRSAKQRPIKQLSQISIDKLQELFCRRASFQQVASYLLEVFSGLLMFDPELTVTDVEVAEISMLIASIDDEALRQARRLFRLIVRSQFCGLWRVLKTEASPEIQRRATHAAVSAIRDQPGFAVAALVQCVRLLREFPPLRQYVATDEDCDKLLESLYFFNEPRSQNT
jgi:hypothetical protein